MPPEKTHDLYDFMKQISIEMSAEYNRIQKRATEDSGTAGDQGEENWAELLRDWLPRDYQVVTKGRIISQDGATSPQIDVLVLKNSYPKKLLNKKIYLAAGVAAAFECKTTLKASHIEAAMHTCSIIKSFFPTRTGTPYLELHSPIIFGLLAHSHSWKGKASTPEQNIEKKLTDSDFLHVTHPKMQLDLLCVSDLAAWSSSTITFIGPNNMPYYTNAANPNGFAASVYIGYTHYEQQVKQFTPIGVFISKLSQRLAWENSQIRDLASYYRITNIAGTGRGYMRKWPTSIYSDGIRSRIEAGGVSNELWNEWNLDFI